MVAKPKFFVGQIVHHNRFEYRGVVVDVDASFEGSESWYEQVARSRPPKDQPWYRVLVDGGEHETYVAERHLEIDAELKPVSHPLIDDQFVAYEDGIYRRRVH